MMNILQSKCTGFVKLDIFQITQVRQYVIVQQHITTLLRWTF